MSDDTQVKVEVGATTAKLEAGMQKAVDSVKGGVDGMKAQLEGMNAMFEKITAGFAMFTAALAGGAALKEFVSGAIETTKEAAILGKTLGITATDASYFKAALAQVGVSGETVSTAASKITMTLLKNEQAFKDLGVATRDSAGHLRNTKDIMLDTNETLRSFKEGTDRNIEGMKIYGRSWAEVAPLVSKFKGETEESRKEAEELNLVVGQESVSAMANYKTAQLGVREVMEGVTNTIGQAIIPRLTELGNWFRSIGPQAVEVARVAIQGYLAVQDTLKDSVKALWGVVTTVFSAIGDAIAAVFGESSEPMGAMEFFQNVVKAILVLFIGFRVGVQEVCAAAIGYINAVKINIGAWYDASKLAIEGVMLYLERIGIGFKGMAQIAQAALHLDWSGMKAAASNMSSALEANAQQMVDTFREAGAALDKGDHEREENFRQTMEKMTDIAVKGRADIDAALFKDTGKVKPVTPIATKDGGQTSEGGKAQDTSNPDQRVKAWEAALLADKTAYMEQHDMREMSLQDEAAYWQKILSTLKEGDTAAGAVKKKIAEATFADEKRIAKQRMDLQVEVIDFQQKMALAEVDKDQEAASHRLALGAITQAQELKQEEAFENRRYEINVKALQARLELLSKDPTTNLVERQKVLDQLLEMEQKHANDVLKIQNKQVLEAKKPYLDFASSVQNSFKQSISSMIQGTTTFAGAVKGLCKSILASFADMVAGMAADWLFAMIKNRVVQATTGVAQVMSNAAVAASAAFASTAAIPIIGPEMAPGAAAAAYSATAAFAPLASARNGFDIPAGLNPVTQLHEREMVLPQAQADAVRNMADGKGGAGEIHLHVHALDGKSVERVFRDNGRHIAAALQDQVRKFAIKGAA